MRRTPSSVGSAPLWPRVARRRPVRRGLPTPGEGAPAVASGQPAAARVTQRPRSRRRARAGEASSGRGAEGSHEGRAVFAVAGEDAVAGVKRTEGATIVARNDGLTFFLFSHRRRRYSLVVGDIESLLELLSEMLLYSDMAWSIRECPRNNELWSRVISARQFVPASYILASPVVSSAA
jgi:hypothetical protein